MGTDSSVHVRRDLPGWLLDWKPAMTDADLDAHPVPRVEALLKLGEEYAESHTDEEGVSDRAGGIIRALIGQVMKDAALRFEEDAAIREWHGAEREAELREQVTAQQVQIEERAEWAATLEALLADVYTILKPLATEGTQATGSPVAKAYALLDAQDYSSALTEDRARVWDEGCNAGEWRIGGDGSGAANPYRRESGVQSEAVRTNHERNTHE